jgi:hypothetical protein
LASVGQALELAEATVHERDPVPEALEPGPRRRQRVGVAIDPEQASIRRRCLENSLGVAPSADRPVDVAAARPRREELEDLLYEHGGVGEGRGHGRGLRLAPKFASGNFSVVI